MEPNNTRISEAPMLEFIIRMRDIDLFIYCTHFLKNHGYNDMIATPFYIYAKGTIPILLSVHADTVYEKPVETIISNEKNIYSSPEGIRGDDRCGVFAVLSLVEKGYMPCLLITLGEEKMGIGSMMAANEIKPCGIHCIIGIDRQGRDEAVFYQNQNEEFIKYLTSFGFIHSRGRLADVEFTGTKWGIASGNLSAGYKMEHGGPDEKVHVDWILEIIEKIETILENPPRGVYRYYNKNYPDPSIIYDCSFFRYFATHYQNWLQHLFNTVNTTAGMATTVIIEKGPNKGIYFTKKRISFEKLKILVNTPDSCENLLIPIQDVLKNLDARDKTSLVHETDHLVSVVTYNETIYKHSKINGIITG